MLEKTEKPKPTVEKYEGPGKFTSAVGGWVLWSIPGTIISTVAALPIIGTLIKAARTDNLEILEQGFLKVKGAKLAITGFVAGTAMAVYGAVSNWRKVGKEEAQLNGIKTQRDEANTRNEGLQSQVNGLNGEVGVYRKRFSEGTASRSSHGSHADAVSQSRDQGQTAGIGA